MSKPYKYKGEEFVVTKPEVCVMKVTKGEYTAIVSIHTKTNLFRGELDGWGSDHKTLPDALDAACQRILDKSAQPTTEQLCSEMDKFHESLGE